MTDWEHKPLFSASVKSAVELGNEPHMHTHAWECEIFEYQNIQAPKLGLNHVVYVCQWIDTLITFRI